MKDFSVDDHLFIKKVDKYLITQDDKEYIIWDHEILEDSAIEHIQKGRLKEAAELLEYAGKMKNANTFLINVNLLTIYKYKREWEKALECFENIPDNKRDHIIYCMVGEISYFIGEYENAKKYFEKSIEQRSDFPNALNNLAEVYLELYPNDKRRLKKAYNLAKKAYEKNNDSKNYRDTLNKLKRKLKI